MPPEPVTRDELAARLEGAVTIFDVRPPDELAMGHIPGACYVTVADLDRIAAILDLGSEIIACCRVPTVFAHQAEIEKRLRWHWRRPQSTSWRVDETYVKVRRQWTYLYRAVDKFGNTIDFYLSPTRNAKAAKRFLGKALNGLKDWEKPTVINTDKAPTYGIAIAQLKAESKCPVELVHRQVKYLNNVVEADHGKLKQLIKPVRGFKTLKSAYATIKGFEVMRALRKGQAAIFNLTGDIRGEARIVERAFGIGPKCADGGSSTARSESRKPRGCQVIDVPTNGHYDQNGNLQQSPLIATLQVPLPLRRQFWGGNHLSPVARSYIACLDVGCCDSLFVFGQRMLSSGGDVTAAFAACDLHRRERRFDVVVVKCLVDPQEGRVASA